VKSIETGFPIVVGAFAVALSAIVLSRAWSSTRDRVEGLTSL